MSGSSATRAPRSTATRRASSGRPTRRGSSPSGAAQGDERTVYLIESSPRDQLQPKLQSYDYLKPGDQRPRLDPAPVRRRRASPRSRSPTTSSRTPTTSAKSAGPPTRRGSPSSTTSGAIRSCGSSPSTPAPARPAPIVDERSDTFIDYSQKSWARYLDATDEILWMSERDGWNHLYLHRREDGRAEESGHDAANGSSAAIDRVDEEARQVWFRAGGIRPGQDPYYIHHARVEPRRHRPDPADRGRRHPRDRRTRPIAAI